MSMKKIFSLILTVITVFSLCACGAGGNGKITITRDTPVEEVTKYLTLDTLFKNAETVSLQWYNVNNFDDEYTQSNEFYTHVDGSLSCYSIFVNLTSEDVTEVWNNYDGISTYVLYNDVPFHTMTIGLDDQMAAKNKFAFDYSQFDSRIEDVKTVENGYCEVQIGAYTDGSLQCMGSYVINTKTGAMTKCTENYFYGAETPYIVSACVVSQDPDASPEFNPQRHFESPHQLTVNYNGKAYTALVDNDTDVEFVDASLNSETAVYRIYSDSAMTTPFIDTKNGHIGKINQAAELWCSAE